MELHVLIDGRTNLAGQICEQIRAAVLDGRLRPGETLPPSRELAARLAVSRNTVSSAYDRLVAEGLLTTRTGAGTYVSDGSSAAPEPRSAPESRTPGPLRPRPGWDRIPVPPDLSASPTFDFRIGLPDWRLFPYATWRGLLSKQLRPSVAGTAMPCDPAGHRGLRAAIARHVQLARAVAATPGDIVVTSGIQQAIDLITRVLLEPGDCVAVEQPGYTPPQFLFESLGIRVVGTPVDDEGLIVDALPSDARLVYVTPSHQMPLGMPMSLRRRTALLAWARRHDAAVIEDDYDSEFRYAEQAPESMQSLDTDGRVLYVGSFSKVMLPTLRLGFVVAPPSLRRAIEAAKFVTDWHTALAAQAALAEFIDSGGLARHIRRMRHTYRVRHQRIVAMLNGPLSRWLQLIPSSAGLHVSAYLRESAVGPVAAEVLAQASATGVEVFDFAMFDPATAPPRGVVFGYGGIPTDRVDEGLHHLYNLFAKIG